MQSKGRARAKKNAAYVLFMDESNFDACQRDQMEYANYEEIEKVCLSEKPIKNVAEYLNIKSKGRWLSVRQTRCQIISINNNEMLLIIKLSLM